MQDWFTCNKLTPAKSQQFSIDRDCWSTDVIYMQLYILVYRSLSLANTFVSSSFAS